MSGIVILGSGLAGYTLAKEIRKLDTSVALVIVTGDDGVFYSKPLLSNALAKSLTAEALVTANATAMAAQLNATIYCHQQVHRIDVQQKLVFTQQQSIPYSILVLANGAEQIDPVIHIEDPSTTLYSVNNLTDYRRFREALRGIQQVVIVGAGLIGCEFANDLLAAAIKPTVIGPGRTPLSRLLPPMLADRYREQLSAAGIQWCLGSKAVQLKVVKDQLHVVLDNGDRLKTQLLFTAVGLQPSTELARVAGLTVNRGVVVDACLRTSFAGIYALGDCAEVFGQVLPYVLPIMYGARALAKTLTGEETPLRYPLMPIVVKTPACPLVVLPAPVGSAGEWSVVELPGGMRGEFIDGYGRLAGFALLGAATVERQQLLKKMAL